MKKPPTWTVTLRVTDLSLREEDPLDAKDLTKLFEGLSVGPSTSGRVKVQVLSTYQWSHAVRRAKKK